MDKPEFLPRAAAAKHLTKKGVPTTASALANQASDGIGPRYAIINGRAIYREADLDAWLTEQFATPVVRRSRRRGAVPHLISTGTAQAGH
jgi:hypothetical protein